MAALPKRAVNIKILELVFGEVAAALGRRTYPKTH